MPPEVVLIGGGARSGKSALALALAERLGPRRVLLATAEAYDDEMRLRIARHRADRGEAFITVEEPIRLVEAIARQAGADVVVVDCLTLWLSNLLCGGRGETEVRGEIDRLVEALEERRVSTILVTNEVGLGIVPEAPLARLFRDLSGTAHQRIARIADQVYFAAMGLCLRIKPSPLLVEP